MGDNLPPGVSISDSNAPWNDPGIEAYFPLECNQCGFVAHGVEEMEDHENDCSSFTQT